MRLLYSPAVPKYLFVAVWCVLNLVIFLRTFYVYRTSPEHYYLHQMLGLGMCISRGTAAVINLNLAALLLPMCRATTSLIRAFNTKINISSFRMLMDHCKGFHILCAWIVVFASVLHLFGHTFNFMNYSQKYNTDLPSINAAAYANEDTTLMILRTVPGVTGLILVIVLSIIVSTSIYYIRSRNYDIFWFTHRLWLIFYVLAIFHSIWGVMKYQVNVDKHTPGFCLNQTTISNQSDHLAGDAPILNSTIGILTNQSVNIVCTEEAKFKNIGANTWKWLVGPLCIFLLDTLYRIYRRQKQPASIESCHVHYDNVLELQISKENFKAMPGQFVLLQMPELSDFEWHPFTVAKCPENKELGKFSVVMKTIENQWTGSLLEKVLSEPKNIISSRVYVDGPFASAMEDVSTHEVAVCVAGGVGFTPFSALLHHIRPHGTGKLERLYVIWINRNKKSFRWCDDLINDVHKKMWIENKPDFLNVELYETSSSAVISMQTDPLLSKQNEHELSSLMEKRLHNGRPQWKDLFQRLSCAHPKTSVSVFCCGPKPMTKEIGDRCQASYQSKTVFKFFHESF